VVDARDVVVVVQQGGGTCAGVLIDDHRIVTAYHCVPAAGQANVETRSGVRARGRVTATDPAADLAVVEVMALGVPYVGLRTAPLEVGEPVFAIGHPYASAPPKGYLEGTLRWTVTEGQVGAVGPRAVQFSAPVNPGNSGGGLFDAAGALVGVVSRRAGDGLGFATNAASVARLLDDPDRRPGLGGGTVTGFVTSSTAFGPPVGDDGLATGSTIGVGLEVDLRDRVVFGVESQVPLDTRWTIADRGGVAWYVPGTVTAGWRQRFGNSLLAPRLDLYAGAALLAEWSTDGPTLPTERLWLAPGFGARLEVAGVGLGASVWPTQGAWPARIDVRARLPGRRPF
jgi:S1-C subfamily serine protease